ncbi:MAG: hypothetical protein MPI95_00365 [Nitrosopumilus sp.]|nr:hypothetical protein [Nitrosopumilus sp.]MDA7943209.1 hypothetical protein [Nitrosopumilus sp.]MDA7952396.1 hypothetical protein [Nitrosopumilus sp.]MDA7957534.1 hypothetical protein [Nitrosopumilus sp.]MDA7998702.1 hypothetical protein [Nitrosopumilus sp.]
MIITCRGSRRGGVAEPCGFVHDGAWGDPELSEHEALHGRQDAGRDGGSFWLGFHAPQRMGGRDGKI